MMFTISVVTPSFNQGRFIETTIRSVLEQGIPGLEYFIADGGSTDETLDVIRRYEKHLRWVSEKDKGQAHAVNKGIRATTGEIIGWLNSDDIYYAGALNAVLDFFENHPHADVVYGDADHIDESGRAIEPYYTEDWNYERLKDICFLCQPAVFFRRRVIQVAGLLDVNLKYCMDYEYWLRLGRITPFVRIDRKLAGSRMYADNKTLGARVAVHREINDMMKSKFGRVPSKWIFAYAHAVVEQRDYDRLIAWQNFLFVRALVQESVKSFIKWGQCPSARDIKSMAQWLSAATKKLLWEHC